MIIVHIVHKLFTKRYAQEYMYIHLYTASVIQILSYAE